MFDRDTVFLAVDIFGIFVGALTGGLIGLRLRYDIMGIWFLALVTGLGGGIIRDTMLPLGPPLALTNPFYLPTVVVAVAAVALRGRHIGQLRKTITWDRGKELSAHATFALETGTKIYFADPHSPWQRPTNENSNGLKRQYFPKGTDFTRVTDAEVAAAEYELNTRPRKGLDYQTPAERLAKLVGVAPTE